MNQASGKCSTAVRPPSDGVMLGAGGGPCVCPSRGPTAQQGTGRAMCTGPSSVSQEWDMGFQPQISTEHLPVQKSRSGPNCLTGRDRGVQTATGLGWWGRPFKWVRRGETFPFPGFHKMTVIHSRKPTARVPSPVFSQML